MTKRVRFLLVSPPYHAGVVESAGVWMSLGFTYVAGHARAAGAEVKIYDAMSLHVEHDAIIAEIEDFKPDMIGIPVITAMEPDARIICKNAKALNPNIMTVLGNVHPTFMWEDLLTKDENVDIIVRGEAEITTGELIQAVAAGDSLERVRGLAFRKDGKPFATPTRPWVEDLDELEPAWDLNDWPRYYYRPNPEGRFAIVSSSRGCKEACSFCSQQKLWDQTWRARNPEKFVAELEMLRNKYDVRVVMFSDETPTVDRARWERLLDLLIERQLGIEILMETRVEDIIRDEKIMPKHKAAGVSHIYLGVESVEQSRLDVFNKNIKVEQSKQAIDIVNAHNIISETSFVLGMPNETHDSIERTVELAKWYAPDMAFFLAIAPWPYADLYPALKDHVVTDDYRKYNLVEPVIKPMKMELDDLRQELFKATGHFFHDKFTKLDTLSEFKRDYLVQALKLLIEHSYLGKEMHAMAAHSEMPEAVQQMLAHLDITF